MTIKRSSREFDVDVPPSLCPAGTTIADRRTHDHEKRPGEGKRNNKPSETSLEHNGRAP